MAKKMIFDFLGKEITITPLKEKKEAGASERKVDKKAPGYGNVEFLAPVLLSESIAAEEKLALKVKISGTNIAQIYSTLMLQIKKDLIGPLAKDYLRSPEERNVNGVVHPRWKQENQLECKIDPVVNLLHCGEGSTLACAEPEFYSPPSGQQIWNIEGIYQRGGGEPFRAKFTFDLQGELMRKTGFYPESARGLMAPFELLIEDGDTFEPLIEVVSKRGEVKLATTNPIMLGGGNLPHLELVKAPPGSYQAGLLVEDFDGNVTRKLTPFSIQ